MRNTWKHFNGNQRNLRKLEKKKIYVYSVFQQGFSNFDNGHLVVATSAEWSLLQLATDHNLLEKSFSTMRYICGLMDEIKKRSIHSE